MITKSNILITGGAGFIGSSLANELLPQNKITVIDNLSMGDFNNLHETSNLTKILGDVTDKNLLVKVLEENDFDYIFHLAAIASVADSVARPYETHQVNFDSTMTLLEILRQNKKSLKRFVFSSSAAVYGDEPTLPKQEEGTIRPLTPYAIDKFASEKMTMIYNNLYDVPTSATRFFNVYGPNQNPNSPYSGFISILVDRLRENTELTIFGDGEQSRKEPHHEAPDSFPLLGSASGPCRLLHTAGKLHSPATIGKQLHPIFLRFLRSREELFYNRGGIGNP